MDDQCLSEAKTDRVLAIYSRLVGGAVLNKADLAQQFHVTQRSIQRDIESLRCFFAEQELPQDIVYDKRSRGYRLIDNAQKKLSNSEVLAVRNHQVMEIQYERMKEPKLVTRRVEPVGIMFSEYYFYLTAFLQDVDRKAEFENEGDLFPTIYRIDRIRAFQVLDEHFHVPYKDRFEEGEFRKRVQFMYGGKLQKIRFRYTGPSLEAVLDRLPTAKVLAEDDDGWDVEAEVFGSGVEMWLRSQGDYAKEIEYGNTR